MKRTKKKPFSVVGNSDSARCGSAGTVTKASCWGIANDHNQKRVVGTCARKIARSFSRRIVHTGWR